MRRGLARAARATERIAVCTLILLLIAVDRLLS